MTHLPVAVRNRIPLLIRILSLLLGGLFVWASLPKIWQPGLFARSLANYHLIPLVLLHPAAIILPWVEGVCGLALLVPRTSRAANLIIGTLLLVFTLAIISAIWRGLDFNCGCFSQTAGTANLGIVKVLENSGLLLIAGLYEWSLRRHH